MGARKTFLLQTLNCFTSVVSFSNGLLAVKFRLSIISVIFPKYEKGRRNENEKQIIGIACLAVMMLLCFCGFNIVE